MSKLDKNYEFYSKEFSEYLNSYYQQFGSSRQRFSGVISVQLLIKFSNVQHNQSKSRKIHWAKNYLMIRLITMGFHHECQHQELLVYDLQHLLAEQYNP